jgi:hypothetical protein
MDPTITNYLLALELGELQVFENMAIVPLSASFNGGPDYELLKEAMDQALVTITEVNRSGSVPELKVITRSLHPILLMDGEELIGAKQNRVLNTSILLGGGSETLIPVSCTEQGRWHYTSATFFDSDVIMSHRSRARKTDTVTGSLRSKRGYSTDQLRVWADIEALHRETGTTSQTGAMRDAYTAKTQDLEVYLSAFECVAHQEGSLVFINGEPIGLDVISRDRAYQALHPKLIKSYAIDALLQSQDGFDAPSLAKARAFLQEAQGCEGSRFTSVGLGYDYRFDGARVVGSALVVEGHIIHLALFRFDKRGRGDAMSGYRQRRDFRGSRR